MDIFDILKAVSKRKIDLLNVGMSEKEALKNAEFDISSEFNIRLQDVRKLYTV